MPALHWVGVKNEINKMKLYAGPTSPYVRKVMVAAHELALADRLEIEPLKVSPVAPDPAYGDINPLGKIPALVLDDDSVLFDSRVICEYLDSLASGEGLFPAAGPARWTALRRQAAADGLLDAALNARYERAMRPEALRWADWSTGQMQKCHRVVAKLETEAATLNGVVDIGTVAVGCALGYLDFRYDELAWRDRHPALGAWYDQFSQRPSMQATVPKE